MKAAVMGIVGAMTTLVPVAHADDAKARKAAVFDQLLSCRTIPEPTARLACFDRQISPLAAADEKGELLVADREQVSEARKQMFGFGGVRIPFLSGKNAEMPTQVEAKLSAVRPAGFHRYEFALDNGMRWRQTDDEEIYPKVGQTVIVKAAALGSYMLKIGTRAVRVVREQ